MQQNVLKGVPSSPGISIGKAFVIAPEVIINTNQRIPKEQVETEIQKFQSALEKLSSEFEETIKKVSDSNQNVVSIIETNILLLNDPFILDSIKEKIASGLSVESAISKEYSLHRQLFLKSKDVLLRDRAIEIDHIRQRLLLSLRESNSDIEIQENTIIIAQSLNTTDVVNLFEKGVKGIVTEVGGIASHCSILARNYEIPTVIGVKEVTKVIQNNDSIILDGFSGQVILNPKKVLVSKYFEKIKEVEAHKHSLGKLVKLPTQTIDGKVVNLLSNLDSLEDVKQATLVGAEGVGLVRSEFLLEQYQEFPSEDLQYEWYKNIADALYPKPVTIRLFDFGSDKYSEGILIQEQNPALGYRGIRFLLARKDILQTQVRALLKSSVNKNIKIMLPMITNSNEVSEFMEVFDICKNQLDYADIPYDDQLEVGLMIETPASVLISDKLASMCNFFSIGTNDLTQYILASDRTNEMVAYLYDSLHPSVLKMIRMTVESAKSNKIKVSICGELAGHSAATALLLGLGIDEFSVSSATLLETKSRIRKANYHSSILLARQALKCSCVEEIRELLDTDI